MIELIYVDNFTRDTVCAVERAALFAKEDVAQAVLEIFSLHGYSSKREKAALYIRHNGEIKPFSASLLPDEECSEIILSNVVAPKNAQEYARENGIIYYFHTAERPHKKYPHINTEYSGESICIYLKRDFNDVGTQFKELQQVLPSHNRNGIQALLRELRSERKIMCIGKTSAARWFLTK